MARTRDWYRRNKGLTYSETVAPSTNKSGAFIGGVGGSGTVKTTDSIKYPKGVALRREKAAAKKKGFGLTAPGGSGTNRQSGWVGEGANRRYVEGVEPVSDRGSASTKTTTTTVSQQSEGRPTPSESRSNSKSGTKGLAADLAKKSSGGEPEFGSLNYFMKKTMSDGRGNAKNRAYTLYKRYKQAQRRNA